ncbi:MAG: aminopeptidase [bacterium]
MRDPRLKTLASRLLDYSLDLRAGDRLLIEGEAGSGALMVALVEETYRREAIPFVEIGDDKLERALLRGASREQLELRVSWEVQRIRDMDAVLYILAGENASELADVPGAVLNASRLASKPLIELMTAKRWCVLRFPTAAAAQAAGMSTEAFEDFCMAVSNLDYARMDRAMDPLVELMSRTDRVHIVGPGTDLNLSIRGMPAIKAAGKKNIPDGEVFTAPVRDSANGTIVFNAPSLEDGTTYERVRLVLKDGRIVEADSSEPEKMRQMLDTDAGARYLGEFAFGVNPYIDRPMKDTLYDEKIAGSLHIACGRAYDEADNGNHSGVHWDLVLLQTPAWGGGEVRFDDVLVRRDGRFVLPELERLNPEHLA